MKILKYILPYVTISGDDYGFGRPRGKKRTLGQFGDEDIQRASRRLAEQLPYKSIKKFMDFEGYREKDWRIDYEGIVKSFLSDQNSKKGPEMVGRLTRTYQLSQDDRNLFQKESSTF